MTLSLVRSNGAMIKAASTHWASVLVCSREGCVRAPRRLKRLDGKRQSLQVRWAPGFDWGVIRRWSGAALLDLRTQPALGHFRCRPTLLGPVRAKLSCFVSTRFRSEKETGRPDQCAVAFHTSWQTEKRQISPSKHEQRLRLC